MRIACLQFAPQVGDIDNDLNRADAVLSKSSDLEDLDLLVLPELAFTGYNFHSLAQIAPYLEPSGSGISALWARTTALKLNCNVVVGYPEKVDVADKWPTSPEFYNSAIMVNRDGETIANYRKSFLYVVDETWALEGREGFMESETPDLGYVAMGICMDINPYKFEAPWHAFEFAFHILEVQANLVILTMAWLTRENSRSFSQLPHEPDMETFMYWIQRLEPVVRSENDEEIIFVVCNRTGFEEDCVYAGTSTVFGIKQGEVNLYGILGRGVKELLVVDTSIKPFAKVVKVDSDEATEATHCPASPPPPLLRLGAMRVWAGSQASLSVRDPPPKLGLEIPNSSHIPDAFRNWVSPNTATTASPAGEIDIPTPTAPSPTPISLRPKFTFADTGLTPRSPFDSVASPVANRPGGLGVFRKVSGKEVDSPITPPRMNHTEDRLKGLPPKKSSLSSSLSSLAKAPPSPPADEEFVKKHSEASIHIAKRAKSAKSRPSLGPDVSQSKGAHAKREDGQRMDTAEYTQMNGNVKGTKGPAMVAEMQQQAEPDAPLRIKAESSGEISPSESEVLQVSELMKEMGTPDVPTRPQSTKSRNASCTRAEDLTPVGGFHRSLSQSQLSIPIMASPSVFYRDFQPGDQRSGSPIPTPLSCTTRSRPPWPEPDQESLGKIAMANSAGSVMGKKGAGSPEMQENHASTSGRSVSRGRQPLPKEGTTNPSSVVATRRVVSGSSADRERVPSNNRSIISRDGTSTASSASWLFGTPPLGTTPLLDPDDEIIAMISLVDRNCPVHNHHPGQGRRQQAAAGQVPSETAQTAQTAQTAETADENGGATVINGSSPGSIAGPASSSPPTQTSQQPLSIEGSIYEVILPPNIRELVESFSHPDASNPLPNRGRELGRSHGSPTKFDPPTPRAMNYDEKLHDDVNVPPVPPLTKQEC